jgi:cation diffusion facilitator family transporter
MKHAEKRQRTQWVIILTAITMVVEIVAGYWTGSMALLADGWHMASHVGALAIAWLGYYLVDHKKFRDRYTFGGGKVLALGGHTNAVVLLITAIWMIAESVHRLIHPEALKASEAMLVAVIGLVVNLISAMLLQHDHSHSHSHSHKDCDHQKHANLRPVGHAHHHTHDHGHKHEDLNMAGAYAHVLADAMTSVLALVALGLAQWKGWLWADAAVGILGAIMILRWGWGLLKESSHQLLDEQSADAAPVEQWLSEQGWSGSCLHLWRVDTETLAMHARLKPVGDVHTELTLLRVQLKNRFHIKHLILEEGTGAECELKL